MQTIAQRKILLLIIKTLLMISLFSSCSSFNYDHSNYRIIASSSIKYSLSDIYDDLLIFQHDRQKVSGSVIPSIKNILSKFQIIKSSVVENKNLNENVAFKVIPYIENGLYNLQIQYSPRASTDLSAYEDLKHFLSIFGNMQSEKEISAFELFYNSKSQSLTALKDLIEIRMESSNTGFKKFKDSLDYINSITKESDKINHEHIYNELYKLKNNNQFLDAIKNNDRISTVNILKQTIPWTHLTPFENQFWLKQLDIIKKPLNLKNKVIVYRGIKSSMIETPQTNFDTILTEQSFYQLSNFFRTNGKYKKTIYPEDINSTVISNYFKDHSFSSTYSLFISFTYNVTTAREFSTDAYAIFALDPRLLIENESSDFKSEREFLASFLTFPEDVLGIFEISASDKRNLSILDVIIESRITKIAIENLKYKFNETSPKNSYLVLKKNSIFHFKNISNPKLSNIAFKDILKQKLPLTNEVIKVTDTSKFLDNCSDLIKNFFNK